jgi:hypothetical protein
MDVVTSGTEIGDVPSINTGKDVLGMLRNEYR